jgi:hypothetical protein
MCSGNCNQGRQPEKCECADEPISTEAQGLMFIGTILATALFIIVVGLLIQSTNVAR